MKGKNRTKRLFLVVFLISAVLLLQIQPSHAQVPILTIAPITWNVIGLDSNDVMAGPDTFLVAARVCNNSGVVANNVESTFVWDSDNPYINLSPGSPSTLTIPSLPVGACTDFYYNVSITRTADAYDTTRRYHITATATGFDPASTPTPRELYVEHLVSQNRNSIISISGPTTVFVGQTYTYVVISQTATNGYEQLESFLNFPNTMFEIESVAVTYTVGGTGDTVYADACGWHNDPTLPDYRTCTTTDKAGGTVTTTYTVLILSAGQATMSALIYDFSGSSYHYNSDFNTVTITVDASEPTPGLSLVKTATPTTYDEVGDVINYSYVLTNTGDATLDGPFTVTDDKVTVTCPSTPASLAPGESITCTGSYIITQADLDNGSVTNTATGHGFYGTTPIDSNQTSAEVNRKVIPAALPVTGFAPGRQTLLSVQPERLNYANLGDFWLEIPALNIQAPIVGVPLDQDGWNLDWLADQIGYLEGTAYPTWNGNSVLTAHVYNASGLPGPFVNLGKLMWGDQVIVHGWGQSYIFEIRSVQFGVDPEDMSVITHEEKPWLTLITCQGYDEGSDSYSWRTVAKAVLIKVK